jgi:putative SOS response-associated peptidase YedK
VPADGWYEWVRRSPRERQPYFMTHRDGGVLAFAGLWTVWGEKVLTCTIVTTAAVGELSLVHDRMPLALPAERWRQWLDGDAATASALLGSPPAEYLVGGAGARGAPRCAGRATTGSDAFRLIRRRLRGRLLAISVKSLV